MCQNISIVFMIFVLMERVMEILICDHGAALNNLLRLVFVFTKRVQKRSH